MGVGEPLEVFGAEHRWCSLRGLARRVVKPEHGRHQLGVFGISLFELQLAAFALALAAIRVAAAARFLAANSLGEA